MSRFQGLACASHGDGALTPETSQVASEQELCAQFVAWMRMEEGHGWWAASELDLLLEHYCDERGYVAPPGARARKLMLQVPGVYRQRHRLTGPVFARVARSTGQDRAVLYWIPPSASVPGPWPASDRPAPGQRPASDRSVAGHEPVSDRSLAGHNLSKELLEKSIP